MADCAITYDLKETDPKPHKPLLTALQKEGLLYVYQSAKYVNRLPNTTVWGVFDSAEDASAAFERAAAEVRKTHPNLDVEKKFVVRFDDSITLSNKRKAPDAQWTRASRFETSRLHQLNDPFFK